MTDPLQGRDPYPREQLETVDLHRERAELLEEIVSTPGPGQSATPARTRALLAVGVAAALVIVGGGAWFATRGSDGDDGADQVAAATSPASETVTDPTTATDPTTDATSDAPAIPGHVPLSQLRKGDVLTAQQCRAGRDDTRPQRVPRRASIYLLRMRGHGDRAAYLRAISGGKHQRWIVVDHRCTVVAVGPNGRAVKLSSLLRRQR
jgi:hypothetical protein